MAHVLAQVADALAEAHAVGLIHRDVKPANILLCGSERRPDQVKVVDFGLVKQLGAASATLATESRVVTGTPLYMAPEAITSPAKVDERSDLYALGAVGYFLLTGRPPFEGRTVVEVCGAHLHKPVVPPSERAGVPVPQRLEALVLRCLAKDKAARPASASEVLRELQACGLPAWSSEQARAWWVRRSTAGDAPVEDSGVRSSPALRRPAPLSRASA